MLIVCSSDGYLTFIKFAEGALGKRLEPTLVPECVRQAFPCVYGIERAESVVVVAVAKEKMDGAGEVALAASGTEKAGANAGADADCAGVAGASGESGAAAMAVDPSEGSSSALPAPHDGCLTSPPRPASTPPASATSEVKKRRIAPTIIGLPGAAGGYGNLVHSDSSAEPRDPAGVLSMVHAQVSSASPLVGQP